MYSPEFNKVMVKVLQFEIGPWFEPGDINVVEGNISDLKGKRACGYVNDPKDRGGETKFGIAKTANPDVDIAALTLPEAIDIYFNKYWLASKCDKLPTKVAMLHFEGAVNHGIGRANKILQTAVGATPDGQIGPATLEKVASLREIDIIKSIANQRRAFYNAIVANNSSQSRFLRGWLSRIDEMEKWLLK